LLGIKDELSGDVELIFIPTPGDEILVDNSTIEYFLHAYAITKEAGFVISNHFEVISGERRTLQKLKSGDDPSNIIILGRQNSSMLFCHGSIIAISREYINENVIPDPMKIHYYRIYTYVGDNTSGYANSQLKPCFLPPENMEIIVLSPKKIKLIWDKHPFEDVTGYIIERKVNYGKFEEYAKTTYTFYFDTVASLGKSYSYQVKAYTNNNVSNPGNVKKLVPYPTTLSLLWTGQHSYGVYSVTFSPDGSLLASGSWGTVKVWDSSNGNLLWARQHSGRVYSVAFSPNGNLLASGSSDKTVKVWSIEYEWKVIDGE